MTDVRVFINGRGLDVPSEASALDALQAADPAEAAAVKGGARSITDSRGLPVEPTAPVFAGAIYRTIRAQKA